ncbi:hypothetical protein C4569_04065, partial [Candidatus Parcubacteria bacterium]
MYKKTLLIFLTVLLLGPGLVLADPSDNITTKMTDQIEKSGTILESYEKGSNEPEIIVAKIINVLLSFLGVIFIILIIFGGFKWMT